MTNSERIRLRRRALVFAGDGRIRVSIRDRGIAFADTAATRSIVERLLDGTGTGELPGKLLGSLDAIGALERLDLPHDFCSADEERLSRTFDFLSSREGERGNRFEMQARVRDAQVLLIGVGGLGSWVAYGLAAAGVGRLRLCDPDAVALSNLNRSVLFDEDAVGRPKIDAARERLARFAPRLRVDGHPSTITGPADVAALADGCDLVIGVADRPHRTIRRWVAAGGLRGGVPVLDAGGGRVGPFYFPGESSCAGCLQAALAPPGSPGDVAFEREQVFGMPSAGSLAPDPMACAAVIVLEAYRFLSGMEVPSTRNAYLTQGPTLLDGTRTELPPHPLCRVCGPSPDPEGGE